MLCFFALCMACYVSDACCCDTGDLEPSLGVLLADFFRLFGRSLNIEEVGISCSGGGSFYNKLDAEKEQPQKLWMLSVEDPADAANDLTKGSWNINMVSPRRLQLQSCLCTPAESFTSPAVAVKHVTSASWNITIVSIW